MSQFARIRTRTAIYERAQVINNQDHFLNISYVDGGKTFNEAINKSDIVKIQYYQN